MYYEVYVDVLFVQNLWMNGLLLLLTAWADRAPVRRGRIMLAAAVGSLGVCLLTVCSAWLTGAGWLLGNIILAAGMVSIAYPDRRHVLFRVVSLYLECFLMNGMLRYMGQFHQPAGIWFLLFGGVSFLCLLSAEYWMRRRRRSRERTCRAVLYLGEGKIQADALFDTGNSLYDPIVRSPVSVLDGQLLDGLLKMSGRENLPHMIPYHTIAQNGILEAYVLDRMELEGERERYRIERPVVARMPETDREYQLILHRDLLSS